MKLTRHELICATNKQLSAIGVKREHNPGWLREAVRTDFDAGQCTAFHQIGALRPKKKPKPPKERALEKPQPHYGNSEVESAARAVVSHWNEFGPAFGFEEAVHRLEKALKPMSAEDFANDLFNKNRSEFE